MCLLVCRDEVVCQREKAKMALSAALFICVNAIIKPLKRHTKTYRNKLDKMVQRNGHRQELEDII